VAIKVFFSADPEALERFEREARAVAALSYFNILAIHDFGREDGTAYAVTELLEGETLRARLAEGPLPQRKAIEQALQIASGLAAAHEKGIVHRDLKPENLFVTKEGRIKILDFGLAKQQGWAKGGAEQATLGRATEPGTVLGTVGYMSPEQVRGEDADPRSDIFAFGAILFEMLSGQRAFQAGSAVETMSAILSKEPPDLLESERELPPALERVVRHCLEKRPEDRFRSAHDLAFALQTITESSGLSARGGLRAVRSRSRARALVVGAALLAAGAALGVFVARRPRPEGVVAVRYLTHSGHDSSPAASPDGRTIAFASDRDGRSRIWLKQLAGGGEAALTSGHDDYPRFSPDGSMILFSRTEGLRTSLYRIGLVGGEPRRIVEDVTDGDWSPDGRRVAFVRWTTQDGHRTSVLGLAAADGGGVREIARIENLTLLHPRWSPDGRWVAVAVGGEQYGTPQSIQLVSADGLEKRALSPPARVGYLSSVAWLRGGRELIYSQAESIAETTGGGARVIRHDVDSGTARPLMWSPSSSRILEVLGSGRILFDARSPRENLREIALSGGAAHWLTRGISTDRQPAYSPDGEWVVFSSNRSGNLDLWAVSAKSGALRRLTDDDAQDWDPSFTRDGRHLVWSSDRGGHFEIWIAEADGSGARQLTRDGVDAENPTCTPDGRFVVYGSGNPAKGGIWRIRPDGTEATRIVAGTILLPETSPDGRHVLYVAQPDARRMALRAVGVEDGTKLPFEIGIEVRKVTTALLGRARWLPDGRAVAFVGQDERGVNGVFVQDFVPGRDTAETRRPLGGFDPDLVTESFDLSPDGSRLTVAGGDQLFSVMLAEGLTGLDSPAGKRP
jgi:Tol biopolymer transport system component